MSRPPNPAISALRASCRADTPLTAFAPWSVQFRKQMKSTDHLPFRVHKRAVAKAPCVFRMRRSTQHGEDTTIQPSVHAERALSAGLALEPILDPNAPTR